MTDRRAIANSIDFSLWSTVDPQVRISLDCLFMGLIGEQRRHAFRKWVHRNTGGPQDKVGRDAELLGFARFVTDRVQDMFGSNACNTSRGDEIDVVSLEFILGGIEKGL